MGLVTLEKHQPKSQYMSDNEKNDERVLFGQISSHTPRLTLPHKRLE